MPGDGLVGTVVVVVVDMLAIMGDPIPIPGGMRAGSAGVMGFIPGGVCAAMTVGPLLLMDMDCIEFGTLGTASACWRGGIGAVVG